jgi:putative flippase GtrA
VTGPLSPPDGPATRGLAQHGAGFLASGILALGVDMGTLALLTRVAGVPAIIARPVGIAVAMVVAWLCNRRWTFAVSGPPTLTEFTRYAAVAWGAAAVNYAIYAGILLLVSVVPPEGALVLSSAAAMVVSYLGMRFGVFR